MAWRPPSRRNPLVALRRVVEQPGAAEAGVPDELARRREHVATVRLTTVAGATALAVRPEVRPEPPDTPPDTPPEKEAPAAGPTGSPLRRSDRARRRPRPGAPPASRAEPSHRQPDREPRALITTTPASPAGGDLPIVPMGAPPTTTAASGTERPDGTTPRGRRTGWASALRAPAHQPAGPWSTTTDAPRTTPTWLRSSPRIAGGATAAATGRWATVASLEQLVEPEDLVRWHLPRLPRSGGRRDPDTGRRPLTARQVGAAMVVCLVVWALLFSPTLYRNAQASQIGARRSAAIAVLRPFSRLSAALGLDRVVRVSDALIGRQHHRPTPLVLPAPIGPAGAHAVIRPVAPRPAPPATLAPLPVPTAANPLRVLVVGDSIGLTFGQQLAAKLVGTGVVKATVDAREGTGLARPDAFDWPAELNADIVQFHPQVVVAMFGGNDDQDLQVNGRYITFGSPRWGQLYAARVAQFAGEVEAGHARLVWSGLPVMRSPAKTTRFTAVMNGARSGLAGRPAAIFVDNVATLAGPGGQYTDALPSGGGQQVIVREPDGVHLSPAGADRLAAKAIAAMASGWRLTLPGLA